MALNLSKLVRSNIRLIRKLEEHTSSKGTLTSLNGNSVSYSVVHYMEVWSNDSPPPPTFENLAFRRAKAVVQYISAGQLTEHRTIGQLLLLKNRLHVKHSRRATSDTLPPIIC